MVYLCILRLLELCRWLSACARLVHVHQNDALLGLVVNSLIKQSYRHDDRVHDCERTHKITHSLG